MIQPIEKKEKELLDVVCASLIRKHVEEFMRMYAQDVSFYTENEIFKAFRGGIVEFQTETQACMERVIQRFIEEFEKQPKKVIT